MKRNQPNRLVAFTVGLLLVLMSSGASLAAQGGQNQSATGSYLVVFRAEVTDAPGMARELTDRHGVTPSYVYQHALKGFAFRGSEAAARALANNPSVAYVEPDGVLYALAQTVPTGILRMDAPPVNTDGSDNRIDVAVAVLDTGVAAHEDLNVVKRIDCTNESGGPPWQRTVTCVQDAGDDGNGHGTHVAGTIGAFDNNTGVVGVAPGAKIWAIKVLDDQGSGTFSMIVAGIDQVAANASTIRVANMSLGGQGESQALQEAIANAVSKGVVFVVAAGNSDADVYGDGSYATKGDNYIPASYPEVMTVSALADSDGAPGGEGPATSYGADDTLASFSNYASSVASNPLTSTNEPVTSAGKAIDVAAPGVDIYSTVPGGYDTYSGTSMASPHVAGRVALYIAANSLTPGDATDVADIRQAIIDGAQAQSQWRTSGSTNDPDGNPEPMAYIGGGGSTPGNTAPTADDQSVTTAEETPVSITLSGADAEDCELSFSVVSGPAHGTVSAPVESACTSGGDTASVEYTPAANYAGSDSFTFRVTDSGGASAEAVVSLSVTPVNDAPVANDDSATTTPETSVAVAVLANDTDPDGDALTVTLVSGPAYGTATVNANGTITYTPDANHPGTDSFVYQVTDPSLASDQATVSITVEEAATGWDSGDLESSIWSDSGNPNGKYSTKDYSFTPALGAPPAQMGVEVNVGSWSGNAATLTAYIRLKGTSYPVCSTTVSGTGPVSCSGVLPPDLVVDGASNTLRLEIGSLVKGESFEVDVVKIHLE